ncbi:hypothetical protein NNJEOMEG_03168 [Fundidesulfovibrio magnetotacticus]|uniref:Asparagine synthetase domain-containing protein n=1 Tax=Fundidesulfovibrio magnetotacticus TaxID=2730080 RepID=A0A6V8LZ65_9BACT|nr:ATP-dependent sacrificial sulfur transferase LarE [Fundidesulfovibrio magnetotacticus]GFK95309.1 hypothetical protein NNJEOMEG_03168 [Fundidesulfovibrio magnetotacticus]
MSAAPSLSPDQRLERLDAILRAGGPAAVAFSGGLDSTFLLHAARKALGDGLLAVTLETPYTPEGEVREARAAARGMGVRHLVLKTPVPEDIRDNPPERCYLCKRRLFGLVVRTAAREGLRRVLDGTNRDDLGDHRPGLRAVRELNVESPLLAAGLGKEDLRELARAQGLAVWDRPAGACLLTRLPHGVRVEEAQLRRIDQAEDFLREVGFPAVRVRCHGDAARIEVPRERVGELLEAEARHGVDARLKALGFAHVCVDLAGYRTGSLNKNAAQAEKA